MTGGSNDARPIDTGVGRFELRADGVIFWKVAFGSTIDENSAREAEAAAKALASGDPVVIIADARELGFADRKARDVFADAEIEGNVATGVIVSSRVVRYLAEQYARQTEGKRPFAIFNVESAAVEWANEQLRNARAGYRGLRAMVESEPDSRWARTSWHPVLPSPTLRSTDMGMISV